MKPLTQYIRESVDTQDIIEDVDFTVGRFQPFTLGHLDMVQSAYKKYGNKIVILYIENTKGPDAKKPFTTALTTKMMEELKRAYPFILDVIPVPNANFDVARAPVGREGWGTIFIKNMWNPVHWLCGEDRLDVYKAFVDRYAACNGFYDMEMTEITGRTDGISGTAAREALKNNDKAAFAKIVPPCIVKFYDELREAVLTAPEPPVKKSRKTKK